ncbi:uncharacterized protein [Halyomorpha halys]|uniref:uncharacterized protein n=1 Tax=Halyomorpha halys TaxID=286706 RepID=UPI0006D518A1|nr:uncharacterized protein LOC106681256 [Halyomorpha halys]XP_014276981.1 uncharacterized protein LOC106681256 [Halyomorpha halys]
MMKSSYSVQKTDLRDCLSALLKNKNKGVSFDEWKSRKTLETFRTAQIHDAQHCLTNIIDRMVRSANKQSISDWLEIKKSKAKEIDAKQKKEEVCLRRKENELEVLKKDYSKKAFRSWLKMKKKETKRKDLRMKEDEACCNTCDEYFFLVKSEYNKRAVEDWLCYLKERHK